MSSLTRNPRVSSQFMFHLSPITLLSVFFNNLFSRLFVCIAKNTYLCTKFYCPTVHKREHNNFENTLTILTQLG